MKYFVTVLFITCIVSFSQSFAQHIPAAEENIEFLITFGSAAPADWGDDDHCQTFFLMLPEDHKTPFFLRVFDPETGGKNDEERGAFNTRVKFSIYGGKGAYSNEAAQNVDPIPGYDSGVLLTSKIFGKDDRWDGEWYSFGPINPMEGERQVIGGKKVNVFKIIALGLDGDDGNLYTYYASSERDRNFPIAGASSFTYEYSFRLPNGQSHIYPFVDDKVEAVKFTNFDFDADCMVNLVSISRIGEPMRVSGDGLWVSSEHNVHEQERGNSLDIQINSLGRKRNNNVVIYITNQYDKALAVTNVPIGNFRPETGISITKAKN